MSELYWITVLGKLSTLFSIATILLFIGLISYSIICIVNNLSEPDKLSFFNKYTKMAIPTFIFCLLAMSFIPCTKQLYLIYGVGSVIDYLQESPEAKQLPDKTLKCLNQWCDEFIEESHETEKCSHND